MVDREEVRAVVIADVLSERARQIATYGHNDDLEDGTGPRTAWLGPFTGLGAAEIEKVLRDDYEDYEEDAGKPTWVHLLREELAEAFKEDDPERLYAEVLQVTALGVSWLEKMRARAAEEKPPPPPLSLEISDRWYPR